MKERLKSLVKLKYILMLLSVLLLSAGIALVANGLNLSEAYNKQEYVSKKNLSQQDLYTKSAQDEDIEYNSNEAMGKIRKLSRLFVKGIFSDNIINSIWNIDNSDESLLSTDSDNCKSNLCDDTKLNDTVLSNSVLNSDIKALNLGSVKGSSWEEETITDGKIFDGNLQLFFDGDVAETGDDGDFKFIRNDENKYTVIVNAVDKNTRQLGFQLTEGQTDTWKLYQDNNPEETITLDNAGIKEIQIVPGIEEITIIHTKDGKDIQYYITIQMETSGLECKFSNSSSKSPISPISVGERKKFYADVDLTVSYPNDTITTITTNDDTITTNGASTDDENVKKNSYRHVMILYTEDGTSPTLDNKDAIRQEIESNGQTLKFELHGEGTTKTINACVCIYKGKATDPENCIFSEVYSKNFQRKTLDTVELTSPENESIHYNTFIASGTIEGIDSLDKDKLEFYYELNDGTPSSLGINVENGKFEVSVSEEQENGKGTGQATLVLYAKADNSIGGGESEHTEYKFYFEEVPTLEPSVPIGTYYKDSLSFTINNTDAKGDIIYDVVQYTTDGSSPKRYGKEYDNENGITILKSDCSKPVDGEYAVTVKLYVERTDDELEARNDYEFKYTLRDVESLESEIFNGKETNDGISISEGIFYGESITEHLTVSKKTDGKDYKIYYTINGMDPDQNSTEYSSDTGIVLKESEGISKYVIKAVVAVKEYDNSILYAKQIQIFTYNFSDTETMPAPEVDVDPTGKTFYQTQIVGVTCADRFAKVYYQIDNEATQELTTGTVTLKKPTDLPSEKKLTVWSVSIFEEGTKSERVDYTYSFNSLNNEVSVKSESAENVGGKYYSNNITVHLNDDYLTSGNITVRYNLDLSIATDKWQDYDVTKGITITKPNNGGAVSLSLEVSYGSGDNVVSTLLYNFKRYEFGVLSEDMTTDKTEGTYFAPLNVKLSLEENNYDNKYGIKYVVTKADVTTISDNQWVSYNETKGIDISSTIGNDVVLRAKYYIQDTESEEFEFKYQFVAPSAPKIYLGDKNITNENNTFLNSQNVSVEAMSDSELKQAKNEGVTVEYKYWFNDDTEKTILSDLSEDIYVARNIKDTEIRILNVELDIKQGTDIIHMLTSKSTFTFERLEAPEVSVKGGNYDAVQYVSLTAQNGVKIQYAFDDGEFKDYTSKIAIKPETANQTIKLRARSVVDGEIVDNEVTKLYSEELSEEYVFCMVKTVNSSLVEGDYYGVQNIKLSCVTQGSIIYYSINNGGDTKYVSQITISKEKYPDSDEVIIEAYAKWNGYESDKATFKYKLVDIPVPSASLISGTYYQTQSVKLINNISENGTSNDVKTLYSFGINSNPKSGSSYVSSIPIEIEKDENNTTKTLRIVNCINNMYSEIKDYTYSFADVPEAESTVAEGSYAGSKLEVIIRETDTIIRDNILYTLDGTDPATSKTAVQCSSGKEVTINKSEADSEGKVKLWIKAYIEDGNKVYSKGKEYTYTFINISAPKATLKSGTYYKDQTTELEIENQGSEKIYYNINSSDDPTKQDILYNKDKPIEIKKVDRTINGTVTLKAVAFLNEDYSEVKTFTYTIKDVPEVVFASDPDESEFLSSLNVSISEGVGTPSGGKIRYTTDGEDPDVNDVEYSSRSFTITQTTTVKVAIFYTNENGDTVSSEVFSKEYAKVELPTPEIKQSSGKYYLPSNSIDQVQLELKEYKFSKETTIRYVIGEGEPTASSPVWTKNADGQFIKIPISSNSTIKVRAFLTSNESIMSQYATYDFEVLRLKAPQVDKQGGVYYTAQDVSLSKVDSYEGIEILYTLNGETEEPKTVYNEPVEVSFGEKKSVTLKAVERIKNADGTEVCGDVLTCVYELNSNTPYPVAKPSTGEYYKSQKVELSSTEMPQGLKITYTTDGSDPTIDSGEYNDEKITILRNIKEPTELKVACFVGTEKVSTETFTYTFKEVAAPTVSPAGGTYTSSQTVTLESAVKGADIYYTTDGSEPTTSSRRYSGAIDIEYSEIPVNLRAKAVYEDYSSTIVNQVYIFKTLNGWQQNGEGKWMYMEKGKEVKGWFTGAEGYEKSWFYFDDNGIMQTGLKSNLPGWDNATFYFNSRGIMQTGWQHNVIGHSGKSYYFDSCGVMQTGWQTNLPNCGSAWYYFDDNGVMQKGWNSSISGSDQFYFKSSGKLTTGWAKIKTSGKLCWYYFGKDGVMRKKCTLSTGYKFNAKGICTNKKKKK